MLGHDGDCQRVHNVPPAGSSGRVLRSWAEAARIDAMHCRSPAQHRSTGYYCYALVPFVSVSSFFLASMPIVISPPPNRLKVPGSGTGAMMLVVPPLSLKVMPVTTPLPFLVITGAAPVVVSCTVAACVIM